MNTTTSLLRLAAAATAVALSATFAGCATAELTAGSDTTAVQAANRAGMTPALHQTLVRSAADRYVRELEERARFAARSPHEAANRYVRELEVRARVAARSPHEAADRYVNELTVRACMAAGSIDVSDCIRR